MTNYVVSAGKVFSSSLGLADTAAVLAGGETSGVSNGGTEYVSSGGYSYGDYILTGGLLVLSAGASGYNDTVSSGGTLDMASGAILGSVTVSAGAVLSGAGIIGGPAGYAEILGTADGVTVGAYAQNDYALANVASGGVVSGALVAYGELEIDSGGSARAAIDEYDLQVDGGGVETGAI